MNRVRKLMPLIPLSLALARCSAPEPPAWEPVRVSPSGRPLDPRPESAEQAERIRRADDELLRDPENPDRIIQAALAREEVWRYNEAVDLYSRGMQLAPGDYRFYLGRAHRILRLRRFDIALEDLNRAADLDPYGFNTAYLRGLTFYLRGEFGRAADEYGRCMDLAGDEQALALAAAGKVPGDPRTCMMIAEDNQSRVAIIAWRYRALRRAGRHEEAARLLGTIPEGLDLTQWIPVEKYGSLIGPDDNSHYYEMLLYFKGLRSEEELLDRGRWGSQWSTVAYGAAVFHWVEGRRERAIELMRSIVDEPFWARLGHVAAEADLLRLEAAR